MVVTDMPTIYFRAAQKRRMALLALALAACAAPIHTDGRDDGVLSSADDLERGLHFTCKGRIKETMTVVEAIEACRKGTLKGKCSFCAREVTIDYLDEDYVAESPAKGGMSLADGTHGDWLYQCTSNARNRHGMKKYIIFGKEQCPKSDGWKVPMYKGKLPVVDKQGVRLNQQGVDDMDSLALTNPCICIFKALWNFEEYELREGEILGQQ